MRLAGQSGECSRASCNSSSSLSSFSLSAAGPSGQDHAGGLWPFTSPGSDKQEAAAEAAATLGKEGSSSGSWGGSGHDHSLDCFQPECAVGCTSTPSTPPLDDLGVMRGQAELAMLLQQPGGQQQLPPRSLSLSPSSGSFCSSSAMDMRQEWSSGSASGSATSHRHLAVDVRYLSPRGAAADRELLPSPLLLSSMMETESSHLERQLVRDAAGGSTAGAMQPGSLLPAAPGHGACGPTAELQRLIHLGMLNCGAPWSRFSRGSSSLCCSRLGPGTDFVDLSGSRGVCAGGDAGGGSCGWELCEPEGDNNAVDNSMMLSLMQFDAC